MIARLVNGMAVDTVDAADRGLAYGDGIFRTLRTDDGQPRWWQDQYAKLAADCSALGLACPDEALLRKEIALVAPKDEGVAKLVVTAGAGARGYARGNPAPTRIVSAGPLPPHAALTDIRARLCQLHLARQPRLAGLKHLNRLENVLARSEWDDPEIHEGLLGDSEGQLVSGVSSNVVLRFGERLVTPPVDVCGVAGVARARLLRAGVCIVGPVALSRLADADEIFLCNSVIGVWRVAELDGRCLTDGGWRTRLTGLLEKDTA